jgi:tetratricopeptide (TPR) repeat protein
MSKLNSQIAISFLKVVTPPKVAVLLLAISFVFSHPVAAEVPADSIVEVKNRARSAAEQMRAGDAKLKLGDISGACDAYARTLELLPSWWLPHLALVRCGRLLGHPSEKLLGHARFAAKARPKIPATHLQLGLTLEELGRRDDAIIAYEASLRLRPDFFQARYRLGLLYGEKGELVDAIRNLNEVIKMFPGHMVALSTLASLHERKGHVEAALNTLKHMLLHTHHPRVVLSRIGRLLSRAGRHQELKRIRAKWRVNYEAQRTPASQSAPK